MGRDPVACTVAWYKRDFDSRIFTNRHEIRGLAIRRVYLDLVFRAEKPRIVNASAAYDANVSTIHHGTSPATGPCIPSCAAFRYRVDLEAPKRRQSRLPFHRSLPLAA